MLYDQAQLAVAYTNAFLISKDEKYSKIVRDILTYVSRDLSHPVMMFKKIYNRGFLAIHIQRPLVKLLTNHVLASMGNTP